MDIPRLPRLLDSNPLDIQRRTNLRLAPNFTSHACLSNLVEKRLYIASRIKSEWMAVKGPAKQTRLSR